MFIVIVIRYYIRKYLLEPLLAFISFFFSVAFLVEVLAVVVLIEALAVFVLVEVGSVAVSE